MAKQGGHLAFVKGQVNVMKDSRATNVNGEIADIKKNADIQIPPLFLWLAG